MILTGRWRCALCPHPVWVRGVYAEWLDHYQTEHQKETK